MTRSMSWTSPVRQRSAPSRRRACTGAGAFGSAATSLEGIGPPWSSPPPAVAPVTVMVPFMPGGRVAGDRADEGEAGRRDVDLDGARRATGDGPRRGTVRERQVVDHRAGIGELDLVAAGRIDRQVHRREAQVERLDLEGAKGKRKRWAMVDIMTPRKKGGSWNQQMTQKGADVKDANNQVSNGAIKSIANGCPAPRHTVLILNLRACVNLRMIRFNRRYRRSLKPIL